MSRTALVVPCYNEASRLDVAAFVEFARTRQADLVLVNDGSTDATSSVLNGLAKDASNITVLELPHNAGKGEAVRHGMLHALAMGVDYVGFWDTDLATPFAALPAFVERLRAAPQLDAVIGSRVRLLGRTIQRRAIRHYTGRVFATGVSLALQLPVYDTQCGAKLFRVTPQLARALEAPFESRWVFDVELLARLGVRDGKYSARQLLESIYEYPLHEWRDVAGTRLRVGDVPAAAVDLWRIYRRYIRANGHVETVPLAHPAPPGSSRQV
jgi:glycosyltransferase involved in cell wall biosynthesis